MLFYVTGLGSHLMTVMHNSHTLHIHSPVGSTRISDWLENNFIMVVHDIIFLFLLWTDNSDWILKILIGKHYKTIFKSVRNACTSPRVIHIHIFRCFLALTCQNKIYFTSRKQTYYHTNIICAFFPHKNA